MKIYYYAFFGFLLIYLVFNLYIISRVWQLRMPKDKTLIGITIYLVVMAMIILAALFYMAVF